MLEPASAKELSDRQYRIAFLNVLIIAMLIVAISLLARSVQLMGGISSTVNALEESCCASPTSAPPVK